MVEFARSHRGPLLSNMREARHSQRRFLWVHAREKKPTGRTEPENYLTTKGIKNENPNTCQFGVAIVPLCIPRELIS